jgi:hypothetical protein
MTTLPAHFFIRTTLTTVFLLFAAVSAHSQSQSRYAYSAAGDEVTDLKTGLIWRRCSEGYTWNGNSCIDNADSNTYTHQQALARAQAQSGTAGWRLPNVKELFSIVDKTRSAPAIDAAVFPATPADRYWSSTPYVGGTPYSGELSYAWYVDFNHGFVLQDRARHNSGLVRLVR